MPESTVHSLEQEIQALQQQLKEKKGALQETQPPAPEEVPTDKEVLRQVIGEKIKEQAPDYQPVPLPAAPAVPGLSVQAGAPAYLDPVLQPQVQRLVAVAFSKGLQVAIKEAVGTQNAALIDAFHDVMVDQFFDELVKRKLVEPVT
mgnify:CR=1 FL=1